MYDKRERFNKHTRTVWEKLNDPSTLYVHWLYFIFKVLASAGTVFLFIIFCIESSKVVFEDNAETAVYVTNSFYTTFDNEQNISWQTLTGKPWNQLPRSPASAAYSNYQFEHLYECMWVAQQGSGLCNASAATVASYKTCLDASYPSQLAACRTFGEGYWWPSANQYSNCINDRLGGNSVWKLNAFRTCIDISLWPLYDVPQDVTTHFFLGSYSWPLLALTSVFILLVFGLYTWYPVDWEDATMVERPAGPNGEGGKSSRMLIDHGKPARSYVRLGMLWSGLAILAALFWLICVMLIAFRRTGSDGGTWPNKNANFYPSTQQTNVITVVSTLAVVFYFLFELSEYRDKKLEEDKDGYHTVPSSAEKIKANGQVRIPLPASMTGSNPMNYYFPPVDPKHIAEKLDREAGELYSPVLLKTWADAYLVDPLFFVGVVGATLQVFTADVYNIFWCLLFNRITHVGVARVIYYAYIQGQSGGESEKNAEAIASTKVLGLALEIAGIFALIVPLYIVFDSTRMLSEYSLLGYTFTLCYIIPQSIRFLGHLILALNPYRLSSQGLYILTVAQFIWAWDLFVRAVILLWLLHSDTYSGSRGTKSYLLAGNQAISMALAL
jgi:hypothetical protein